VFIKGRTSSRGQMAELCRYHTLYGTIDSMVLGSSTMQYHILITSCMVLGKTRRTHHDSRGLTPKKKSLYCRINHSIQVRSVTRKPTHVQHQFGVNRIHTQDVEILVTNFWRKKLWAGSHELASRSIFVFARLEKVYPTID